MYIGNIGDEKLELRSATLDDEKFVNTLLFNTMNEYVKATWPDDNEAIKLLNVFLKTNYYDYNFQLYNVFRDIFFEYRIKYLMLKLHYLSHVIWRY